MSKDLNLCQFIGRIGKDIELKYMPNGDAVANFSIACGDDYKDKQTGQKVEQTNWINVVAFRRLAEILGEYCNKGDQVYISGKQRTRKYQAQDGSDRYSTEIVANEMQMLGSAGGAGVTNATGNPAAHPGKADTQQQRADTQEDGRRHASQMDSFDLDEIPF